MKFSIKIIFCSVLFISNSSAIFCQTKTAAVAKVAKVENIKLALIAKYYGDSAVLRWGFDAPFAWTEIDKAGFIIERVELDKNNKPLNDAYQKVAVVKSWSLEEFKNNAPRTDSMAMVAAQCLYGKPKNTDNPTGDLDLSTAASQSENKLRFAQIAADLSPVAAEGLGWRWVDRNVKPNRKYIYRLHTPLPKSLFFQADSTGFILPTDNVESLTPPQGFTSENFESNAILNWAHSVEYTAYLIEKSGDGKSFLPAVKKPYIAFKGKNNSEVYFKDSLEQNYKPYYYRVRGLSPFGEKSAWSEVQILKGRDLTPPPIPDLTKAVVERSSKRVDLEWQIPFDVKRTDLKGFYIAYSKDLDHPFVKITKTLLPVMVKQYTFTWDKKQNAGYYKVIAVDTAGNESASHFKYVFLNDLDPPSKPQGLIGKIDSTGKVKISWAKPIEDDVKGYIVQFANALDHPFVGRSKGVVEDTIFTDSITLHTLTEKIYYRIAAVDLNENVSDFSNILALKKPDIIKPVPPNFYDYRATDSTIFLAWHPSQSEDAVKQRLYRKLANGTDTWKVIAEMDNTKNTFTDKPPTVDLYAYSIEAEDDDGLRSLQNDPIFLKIVDDKKLKMMPQLAAVFDEKTKTVHLSWQFAASQKINYLLYRAVDDLPLQHIKTIAGETRSFDDAKVVVGTKYRYAIKAIENNERESKLSDAVKVLVN